jgi:hypothetical protein
MNDMTVFIRSGGSKEAIPTQNDIVLQDLLNQLAGRGIISAAPNFIVTKVGSEEALDQGLTLADLGVVDQDVLDLALPTKAGAEDEPIDLTVRCGSRSYAYETRRDATLCDLIGQIAGRDDGISADANYVAVRQGGDQALDLSLTVGENGLRPGDSIDLACPTKAG